MQDAWLVALERWPADGIPRNPGAWITTTARNRAIDRMRRARVLETKLAELEALTTEEGEVPDDRLRLMFTCCHPALAAEARVALTLRTLGGLSVPGGRARLPRRRAGDGQAPRARQAQDRRRRHRLPRAGGRGAAAPAAVGARRRLPDLQRGLRGDRRRRARAARAVRRGDPARPPAGRADARPRRAARAAGADAAPPRAARRARRRRRPARAARRPGPRAVAHGRDRRGPRVRRHRGATTSTACRPRSRPSTSRRSPTGPGSPSSTARSSRAR